jgi:hypothetical protein
MCLLLVIVQFQLSLVKLFKSKNFFFKHSERRAYRGIIDSPRGESIFATGVPKSLGEPRGGAPMALIVHAANQ